MAGDREAVWLGREGGLSGEVDVNCIGSIGLFLGMGVDV